MQVGLCQWRTGWVWLVSAAIGAAFVGTVCAADARASGGEPAGSASGAVAAADRSTTRADVWAAMRRMRALGVPSVRTMIVTPRGQEVYTLGPRRLGGRQRARIGDRMRIGSVTKTLTATVIMQLVHAGKLRLSDPVERVLPGVVPGGDAITIEQLLGMRSGLFTYNQHPAFARAVARNPRRGWSPQELLAFGFSRPAGFAPGAKFEYSNTNTIILGLVIEALTGQPYAQAVRDRIVRPLGLRRTEIPAGRLLRQPRVDGYIFEGNSRRNVTTWSPSWGWAAGGGVSTPPEIGRFMRALLSGRVVPRAAVRTMLTRSSRLVVPPVFPRGTYGLGVSGVDTRCGRLYGHGGEISGYRTWVVATRDGRRSVVVSANVGARVDSGLPPRVERAMTGVLNAAACRAVARGSALAGDGPE
jgi:D-alanyl-D-alanine carboxypeptidase